MTAYNLAINRNPDFQTVNSLTNLVFDRNNVRSGRMATEAQIQQLWQDIIRLEERIDYCCRDIVYWDFRVRIRDKYGNVMSDFLDNRTTGIARRGKNFKMTLPIKAVPKYEVNLSGSTFSSNYIDGDTKKCVKDGSNLTSVNGLCSLLYRGSSGQYFDMSTRKTDGGLAVGNDSSSFVARPIDVNGNEISSVNMLNSTYAQNKYFASANSEGDITIDCMNPIGSIGSTKHYGRVFYLDVRDVTLG